MIISASRRTDIPAFYADWLMNRLRSGYCLVSNPWNPKQVSRISLVEADIDAIVFWTKNPAPLMPYLPEIDGMGLKYCFLFTLNDYPADLEPHVPELASRIQTFRELSAVIGKQRLTWRYDPIIISRRFDPDYHALAFKRIADNLSGSTDRVIVSIADFYAKTKRRLSAVESATGDAFIRDPFTFSGFPDMTRSMSVTAAKNGMTIQSCAEDDRLEAMGIKPGKCIDDGLLKRALGISVSGRRDSGQRPKCLCVESRDIGANNSCRHGCEYCYATSSQAQSERYAGSHDPAAPML